MSEPPARQRAWQGELTGALGSTIAGFSIALSMGILAFAPLGPDYLYLGATAGFAAAIYGQLAATLAGGTIVSGASPRASTSLIIAGLVTTLAADPVIAPSASRGPGLLVAMVAITVVLAGLFQVVFAWLRVGKLARYVPYPFISGFMTGVAILVILAQVQPLTGMSIAQILHAPRQAADAFLPGALVVGAVTAGVIFVAARHSRRMPPMLWGLVAGLLVFLLLRRFLPGVPLGMDIGPIEGRLPLPTALGPLASLSLDTWRSHAVIILATAAMLALLSMLDSMFAMVSVDYATDGRHDARRELVAHGLGNIVSGLCGGVPLVYSAARGMATWRAGGSGRTSGILASLMLAGILVFGAGLIARMPVALLGGLMLTIGVGLIDTWARGLLQRMPTERSIVRLLSVGTVLVVAATTILSGFLPAVAIGLVASAILLFVQMNRSLVRNVVPGILRPSRRVWSSRELPIIRQARQGIRVVEMEGPLFFGSAERLADIVEPLAGEVDTVVLDFRHVNEIDATAALLLERLVRRMELRSTTVLLAGVTPGGRHGQAFQAHDVFTDATRRPWFRDADRAIEWAERKALRRSPLERESERPFEAFSIFAGMSSEEVALVRSLATREEAPRGRVLFREGDAGDTLYLVARGAVEISIETGPDRRSRIVTIAAGAIFGEAALLDARPRSATAVVVERAVFYELKRDALLEALPRDHPRIAVALLVAIARHMSWRMRENNEMLRGLEDSRG